VRGGVYVYGYGLGIEGITERNLERRMNESGPESHMGQITGDCGDSPQW